MYVIDIQIERYICLKFSFSIFLWQSIEKHVFMNEILIYGEIGCWGDNSSHGLIRSLAGFPTGEAVTVRINSLGGDVIEALAMYHILKSEKRVIVCQVDGVAASAGSIIAMGGNTLVMASIARLMIHLPSVSAQGDWKHLTEYAALLKSFAETMAKIYAAKTGKTEEEVVEGWLQPSTEKWFTADEAVAAGLADSIINSDISIAATASAKAVFNSISKLTKIPDMKKIIAKAAEWGITLAHDATEEAVVAAIKAKIETINATNEALKADLIAEQKKGKKEAAQMLVDAALSSNKITASQKESMMQLAENDFPNAKALLDSMTPRVSIAAQMAAATAQSTAYTGETFAFLHKNNPKELARIKEQEPVRYEALKAAHLQK